MEFSKCYFNPRELISKEIQDYKGSEKADLAIVVYDENGHYVGTYYGKEIPKWDDNDTENFVFLEDDNGDYIKVS